MTMPNELELEERLARLAAVQPEAQAAERALGRVRTTLLRFLGQSQLRSRWIRIAVAAALVVAVGGLLFSALLRPEALALAEVQARLEQTGSITAEQTSFVDGKAAGGTKIQALKEGLLRLDQENGNYTISDLKKHTSLTVEARGKRALLIRNLAPRIPQNLYDMLRTLPDKATRSLGEKDIDGKRAAGFIVPFESGCGLVDWTVWVELKTHLPIRIEIVGHNERNEEVKQVIHDIVFDRPIAPNVFSIQPPADYALTKYGTEKVIAPVSKELRELVLTPKVGLGPVKFGMSKNQVIELLGEPDQIEQRGTSLDYLSRGYNILVSPHHGVTMIFCISQGNFLVKVTDFAGQTAEKIKLGASRAAIEKAYGDADAVDQRSGTTINMEYSALNLNFTLSDDKLSQMTAHAVVPEQR